MGEVIKFPGITFHDIDTSEMLRSIADTKPKNAFVIVWPGNGELPTYHSSTGDTPIVLMRLAEFQHKYFNGDFNG